MAPETTNETTTANQRPRPLANRFLATEEHFTVVADAVSPSWWSRNVLLGPMASTASKFYAHENPKRVAGPECWVANRREGVVLLIHSRPRHGILNA
jgi:hypothetical protein